MARAVPNQFFSSWIERPDLPGVYDNVAIAGTCLADVEHHGCYLPLDEGTIAAVIQLEHPNAKWWLCHRLVVDRFEIDKYTGVVQGPFGLFLQLLMRHLAYKVDGGGDLTLFYYQKQGLGIGSSENLIAKLEGLIPPMLNKAKGLDARQACDLMVRGYGIQRASNEPYVVGIGQTGSFRIAKASECKVEMEESFASRKARP